MISQSSSSSSDSSLLDPSDPAYAIVQIEGSRFQNVPRRKTETGSCRGEKSSSRRCSLAVVSLAVSVVCLLLVALGLTLLLGFPRFFSGGFFDQGRVCMPCSQVSPSPLAEGESPMLQQLDIHQDKDGLESEAVCCASTPAQYATLFKLILKRQEGVKKLADIMGANDDSDSDGDNNTDTGGFRRRAVSAHLLTKPTSPDFVDEQGHSMQQWKSPSESPMSHLRGVKFHNHKLYVRSPGIYFIYCQILFNRAPPPPKDGDPNSRHLALLASHYVRRHSLLYPASSGLLLKARHTRASGQDDRHSSYVGGLFYLHAGDQLFVQVSVPELVSRDDRASFFGLFKVGN